MTMILGEEYDEFLGFAWGQDLDEYNEDETRDD